MLINLLKKHITYLLLLSCALHLNSIYAQDLMNDTTSEITLGDESNLFSEKINIISNSGKILIISNSNQLLSKGDFISLVLPKKGPIARAIVAKVHGTSAGIKVIKIYSLTRWKFVRKNLTIQIKKGDDTALFTKKKKSDEPDELSIDSQEDLFNDTGLNKDGLNSFYKDRRHIKPDNIVSVGWNKFTFANTAQGGSTAGNQFSYAWAFQFADNLWIEGLYGRTSFTDMPGSNVNTIVNNYTVRCKYTFKAPLYSFIMPYIGFQTYSVSSPTAGTTGDTTIDDRQLAVIESLQITQIAIGITVLRRLVPGWFIKATLGNDIFNLGFGIEF